MSEFVGRIPSRIDLYEEGDLNSLDITNLGEYLEEKTHIPFRKRGNIYERFPKSKLKELSKEFAWIRVRDPGKIENERISFQAEVDYEKRRLQAADWKGFGILYDGFSYQRIVSALIFKNGHDLSHCSILFTNQLFGTWDADDRRYHARVSLYGFPSLISIAGLVIAPAKPKEFYLKRRLGTPGEDLKEEYQRKILDHGDSRMTEVLKGYGMQAFLFHLTGDPFCEDRNCRFFNSHWQEEVLHSQMNGPYEFCSRHEKILKGLRERR